jgi:hypothetical protein
MGVIVWLFVSSFFHSLASFTIFSFIHLSLCLTLAHLLHYPLSFTCLVVIVINGIRKQNIDFFDAIIVAQDWHCTNHVSFASQVSLPTITVAIIVIIFMVNCHDICDNSMLVANHLISLNCHIHQVANYVVMRTSTVMAFLVMLILL